MMMMMMMMMISRPNKSIYIAHRRETSNALNASVRCEQKRLQRLSGTVPANNWLKHAEIYEFSLSARCLSEHRDHGPRTHLIG